MLVTVYNIMNGPAECDGVLIAHVNTLI